MIGCPHGDPSCPCQDSTALACHYEGEDAFVCLTLPNEERGMHCHAEGCQWEQEGCGLAKLGIPVPGTAVTESMDPLHWVCGAIRFVDSMGDDFWNQTIERGERRAADMHRG